MVVVRDLSGNSNGVDAQYTRMGNRLASNITVSANSGTTPMPIGPIDLDQVSGGVRAWDVQFTGTSIKLQALGSDGLTWRDVASVTTSGVTSVYIGGGASVRLFNPNGTDDTAVSSTLS